MLVALGLLSMQGQYSYTRKLIGVHTRDIPERPRFCSNDLPGATLLRDQILNVVQGKSVSELRIGLESTSVYSFHPSMYLHNDESIRALGGQVLVMNPKQIANFKKSYSDMNKTDEIDAFVIDDYLRFDRLPMSVVKGEQYVALQQLTRSRYNIVRQITQEKQRFLQYLSY